MADMLSPGPARVATMAINIVAVEAAIGQD
jgi:hypothetical protein